MLAHEHRAARLRAIPEYRSLQRGMAARRIAEGGVLPYLTEEGILDTYRNTQYFGEDHRRLTPRLQELYQYDDSGQSLMDGIDQASWDSTERLLNEANKNDGQLSCDVAILGQIRHFG